MSGIVGLWNLDGHSVDVGRLQGMIDTIAHRGPDAKDYWVDDSIGMGHVLLRTVPEAENEAQPLASEDGSIVLTMDGRIDNRRELIRLLGLPGSFMHKPDCELVLAGYERWGRAVTEHLLGDFAFAIWDARSQHLLLARDHFGVRPLHYVHRPGELIAFASEANALRQAGVSDGDINELKVAEFLILPVDVDPDVTYWDDIFAVPPAHTIRITPEGQLSYEQYWALDPNRETKLGSDEAYIERFRDLLCEAVRCRMRSSAPVGSMLSGGLDSTSIACIAAQELEGSGQKLHTLSAVFDTIPEANERVYQQAALDMYSGQMESTFFAADEISPLHHQSQLTQYLGRPNEGINAYIPFELYRRAGEQGLRVVLDGFDGDTTVSHGRAYYNELLWSWRWIDLWKEVRASAHAWGGDKNHQKRAFRGWIKHYLRQHPLTAPLVRGWRALRGNDLVSDDNDGTLEISSDGGSWRGSAWRRYIRDGFLERVQPYFEGEQREKLWKKERHHHYMMLMRPMMENALQAFDAKASAAGIEARFPFYDVRLVEYCLSLPGRFKKREGWDRWIERVSMEGVLPDAVRWRRAKPNLMASYVKGLLKYDKDTFSEFGEKLMASKLPVDIYLNSDAISDLARRMASGKLAQPEHETERVLLWRALALHGWLGGTSITNRLHQYPQSVGCEVH